ncbi:aldehyde reductase [Flavobacterium sp. LS1R49]|uniref:Aldehyde reductase n=1 Tax=Flavobacterium shii TaxID=2987687 RepID=A0A9X2ZF68_9FLAO|nr:aldehyde reductase [Flavobacterium shii]MCV9926558.1 aldehyde reductase [Flavobacterium shii]
MEDSNKIVLVTGGSGFVGIHCVLQLLQKGYSVRTTIPSVVRKDQVIAMLKKGGITNFDNLSFIVTDLTSDQNWDEAVKDCYYILHVVSPIFLRVPKHEDGIIKPAVEGTLRVLKAARNAGVKRVVMTSNFSAVGYSHKDKTTLITEADWTDPNEKGLSIFNKSKVLAEKAAWDFIEKEGGTLELSVINPMGIFGPSLNPILSSGFQLFKGLIDGSAKSIPNINFYIVDVRDLADLHIRAMTNPAANGQRFLALGGENISLLEISKLLKIKMPEVTKHATSKTRPDWIVHLKALFNEREKTIASLVGVYHNASNEKAKKLLGWNPRSNEEAILATTKSILEFGHLKTN